MNYNTSWYKSGADVIQWVSMLPAVVNMCEYGRLQSNQSSSIQSIILMNMLITHT